MPSSGSQLNTRRARKRAVSRSLTGLPKNDGRACPESGRRSVWLLRRQRRARHRGCRQPNAGAIVMNTQITNALTDVELELVSGGCYKREESYGCDESESND